MTITLGYWMIPLAVTLLSYIIAYIAVPNSIGKSGSLYTIGFEALYDGISGLFYFAIATIVTLIAWVIYFAAT